MDVHTPKSQTVTVRHELGRVMLIVDGHLVLDMTWQQALELGRATIFQARKAEELVKVDQVIYDQAILMRAGVPLQLTTNKDMAKIAGNEAAWNSNLRRYMPDKIDQSGIMYPPTVVQDKEVMQEAVTSK